MSRKLKKFQLLRAAHKIVINSHSQIKKMELDKEEEEHLFPTKHYLKRLQFQQVVLSDYFLLGPSNKAGGDHPNKVYNCAP